MDRRRIVLATTVLGALLIAVVAGVLYGRRAGWLAWRPSREPLPVAPAAAGGATVTISAGEIAVRDFVRYLGEATGARVLAPSAVLDRKIVIAATVEDATPEIVRSILEANGLGVGLETLPDGETVIRVRAVDG